MSIKKLLEMRLVIPVNLREIGECISCKIWIFPGNKVCFCYKHVTYIWYQTIYSVKKEKENLDIFSIFWNAKTFLAGENHQGLNFFTQTIYINIDAVSIQLLFTKRFISSMDLKYSIRVRLTAKRNDNKKSII